VDVPVRGYLHDAALTSGTGQRVFRNPPTTGELDASAHGRTLLPCGVSIRNPEVEDGILPRVDTERSIRCPLSLRRSKTLRYPLHLVQHCAVNGPRATSENAHRTLPDRRSDDTWPDYAGPMKGDGKRDSYVFLSVSTIWLTLDPGWPICATGIGSPKRMRIGRRYTNVRLIRDTGPR